MKFFSKKKNIQKIIIALVVLILFNFIVPPYSNAGVGADIGGVLSSPIVALLAVMCDSLNCIMANFMVGGLNWFEVYPKADGDAATQITTENPYDPDLPTVVILESDLLGDYGIPNLTYTPGRIFSGDVKALDVNFFTTEDLDPTGEDSKSIVAHLRGIVSSWYIALRNIAIVGLMSVLLYLGIRLIVTSSNAEKAKYKQSILDWLVAMCLVFFLHYIMSFTMLMVDSISDMIGSHNANGNEVNVAVFKDDYDNVGTAMSDIDSAKYKFSTSLMGAARIQVEYVDGGMKWSYLIMYMALTLYTLMFTITYIKRVINMVFLTVMAPLVALTYPIDKAGDSKAQAFSFWLKEYIYNALMQPLHLLLYTVLVSSALSLAASNMLYAIVALAFILPAEKILKQMFNFRNSVTGGSLGGFAGGMIAKTLLDTAAKGGKPKGQSAGRNDKVRTANTPIPKDSNAPSGVTSLFGDNSAMGEPVLSSRSQSALPVQGANNGRNPIQRRITQGGGTQGALPQGGSPQGGSPQRGGSQGEFAQNGAELGGNLPENNPAMVNANNQGIDPATLSYLAAGYGMNSEGNYYNPHTRKYDENYDPHNDEVYNSQIRMAQQNAGTESAQAENTETEQPEAPQEQAIPQPSEAPIPVQTPPALRTIRKPTFKERMQGGLGNVGNLIGERYTSAGGKKGVMKALARGTLRAGAMVGGTAIGLAAGIVSDDLNNIGKFALGGAVAGSAIGNNLANRVEGVSSSRTVSAFREGFYTPEELAQQRLDKNQQEFKNSYANRQYFKDNFRDKTDAQIDDIMERASKYNRYGIKDLDRIKDAIKLEDQMIKNSGGENRVTTEQREAIQNKAYTMAKIRADIGAGGFADDKAVESRQKALSKQLQASGMDKAKAQNEAERVMNFMRQTIGK